MAIARTVSFCCLVPPEAFDCLGGDKMTNLKHDAALADSPPTLSDRIIALRGAGPAKKAACRDVVWRLHNTQDVRDGDDGVFVVLLPQISANLFAKPEHSAVRELVRMSGAAVSFSRNAIDGTSFQPVRIIGDIEQTVNAAQHLDDYLQRLSDEGTLLGPLWQPDFHEEAREGDEAWPGCSLPCSVSGRSWTACSKVSTRSSATTARASRTEGRPPSAPSLTVSPKTRTSEDDEMSLAHTLGVDRRDHREGASRSVSPALSVTTSARSSSRVDDAPRSCVPQATARGPQQGSLSSSSAQSLGTRTRNRRSYDQGMMTKTDTRADGSLRSSPAQRCQRHEEELLRILLGGSRLSQAQLRLIVSDAFVKNVLMNCGHIAAISQRSGSRFDFDEKSTSLPSDAQAVVITGTILGNSIAALHVQELLLSHGYG